MPEIRRLAIVNRGEAAMRCVRAVKSLRAHEGSNLEVVALYTDAEAPLRSAWEYAQAHLEAKDPLILSAGLDWAELLVRRPLKSRRVKPESWTQQPGWHRLIRSLAARLEHRGRPDAVAAFRLDP